MSNTMAKKMFGSTLFFWLVLAGLALWSILPIRNNLRLGIDLVGGTYITLEVHTEKAIETRLIDLMQSIKNQLKKSQMSKPQQAEVRPVFEDADHAERPSSYELVYTFEAAPQAQALADMVRDQHRAMKVTAEGNQVKVRFSPVDEKRIKREAVDRDIDVIRNRINRLGVSETPVAPRGDRNIIVELPDVSDPQQAKAMIGKAGVLELKIVEKIGRSEEELLYEFDDELPSDLEIVPGQAEFGRTPLYYLVSRYADLTGDELADAKAMLADRKWVVGFTWMAKAAEKFYDITSKNRGKQLAIILDGNVISAPSINEAIAGGSGTITGGFDANGAKELALILKSGSFAAPISFEEERQVGPSLGAEQIKDGFLSCLVALGLVFLFAIGFYKVAGLFATLALAFNLLLILWGMKWMDATLTLPGIAGMVLTIGMAVDASILIYERIKEELRNGKRLREAVDLGFSSAQWVILDSNITTFIVGLVLYYFGTGPIQGFAVTMMLGIVATLITGLFFLRSIFTFILSNLNVQKLSI